jgi:hypothetical protein
MWRSGGALTTGLALMIPLSSVGGLAASQAPQAVSQQAPHHHYFVEYHKPSHKGWHVSGPYRSHKHAKAVAHHMRAQGLKARVVQR